MKILALLLAAALPALAGDRVNFSDELYSLEFPQGWKKTAPSTPDAEFARESPDKTVVISVNSTPIPKDAAADLDGMAKASAASYAKAIEFKGEAHVSEGTLDGCEARFITLAPQKEEEGSIAMFAVFVDSKKHLVRVIATMSTELPKETKDQCLEIVKSFRREDVKE